MACYPNGTAKIVKKQYQIKKGGTISRVLCPRLSVEIRAEVSCAGRTGVEMEALTAAATAALTVYDMCKAVQKDMVITDLRMLQKTGGVHGDFERSEDDG